MIKRLNERFSQSYVAVLLSLAMLEFLQLHWSDELSAAIGILGSGITGDRLLIRNQTAALTYFNKMYYCCKTRYTCAKDE